jgi:ubiquinol-cytochrome c reductase cytochrome b subunit
LLSLLHVLFLHTYGGGNKLELHILADKLRFAPYYLVKDIYFSLWLFLLFFFVVGFLPNMLLHPDNYIQADPLLTPPHIVPEWYFLIFYAMLRSIPSKIGGVVILFFSIFILLLLPFLSF